MTPAARVSAAIEVLDRCLSGTPVEKALTNWGRSNRYAGSKDRAAVRDHVFNAYRCCRSHAAIGGSMTGRGLMLGTLKKANQPIDELFNGARFAPEELTEDERAHLAACPELTPDESVDCPNWLWPMAVRDLGENAETVFRVQQSRAPVFLRVNLVKSSVEQARKILSEDGINTELHPRQETAIRVILNPRRVQQSRAFQEGLVELQDASSQAIADFVPVEPGMKVLDFCAGAGGKTLAMAARCQAHYSVYDVNRRRLEPIRERARRAGVKVTRVTDQDLQTKGSFEGVLCDVPCSGSGSWRRSPEGKWSLTNDRLDELLKTQAEILDKAADLVAPGGWLVHATCSVLHCENEGQVEAFLDRHENWQAGEILSFLPDDLGDGLFAQVLLHK